MSAIAGFALGLIPQWTRDHLNMVPLDRLGDMLYEDRKVSNTATGFCGVMTKTAPVTTYSKSISGYNVGTFKEDYYYRVHIIPNRIDVGNMLSAQTHEVEVWNAWPSDHLLESVVGTNTDGMDLLSPAFPPTDFGPLEVRTYSLTVQNRGAPIIDARFIFKFTRESPHLAVTGRRVLIWPFMPQTNHKETLEWLTDIIPSYRNEQRLALRTAPRQSLAYVFQLNSQQFSRAKAIANQWAHRVYGVPVWSELTRVGVISQGATEILLDTTNQDYRVGGIVMVWESDLRNVASEILSILPDRLQLKLPMEESYSEAYVSPLRFAMTPGGMQFKRGATDITIANASFQVTENMDLGSRVGYPQYRGKDVLDDPTVLLEDLNERISRATDIFDNGSGPIVLEVKNNWVSSAKVITIDTLDRATRWKAREWLHSRRGKQKSFWVPSWNPDLILLEDVEVGGATLTVRNIGYSLYYQTTDIMFKLRDGSQYFTRATSGDVDAFGNDRIYLEVSSPIEILVSNVELICFMSHVRLNTDRAEIKHGYGGRSTTSLPIMETPE